MVDLHDVIVTTDTNLTHAGKLITIQFDILRSLTELFDS